MLIRSTQLTSSLCVIIAFFVGLLFRMVIGSLSIGTLPYDMKIFDAAAKTLTSGEIAVDCCLKNQGYAVFLSIIYKIFGSQNTLALHVIQSMLDTTTAILLWYSAKRIFQSPIQWIVLLLYLFNPLTASYTALRLGEIITIWYVAVLILLITSPTFITHKRLWFYIGIVLGLIQFTKISLTIFCIASLVSTGLFIIPNKRKLAFFSLSVAGFLIAVSYTLASNFFEYRVLSIIPPYRFTWTYLYANFYRPPWPEVNEEFSILSSLPAQYSQIITRYEQAPIDQKNIVEENHRTYFFQTVVTNWPQWLRQVSRNIVLMWNKSHLFYYYDPFYPYDRWPLQILNAIWLSFAGIGVIYTWKYNKKPQRITLFLFSALLTGTITFFFSLMENESRLSLYGYPLIFLFAGQGTYYIQTIWKKNNKKSYEQKH